MIAPARGTADKILMNIIDCLLLNEPITLLNSVEFLKLGDAHQLPIHPDMHVRCVGVCVFRRTFRLKRTEQQHMINFCLKTNCFQTMCTNTPSRGGGARHICS